MSKWDARDLAHAAAIEDAGDAKLVGEFVTVDFDDEDRIATYLFEANLSGYRGWRWLSQFLKLITNQLQLFAM